MRPLLPRVHICTIVAATIFPLRGFSRRSSQHTSHGAAIRVLVIDDIDGEVRAADEPFEVVDVRGPVRERPPSFIEWRRSTRSPSSRPRSSRGCSSTCSTGAPSSVIYLDPDIEVFDRLDELAQAGRGDRDRAHPARRRAVPRDRKMTDEKAILRRRRLQPRFHRGRDISPGRFLDFWQADVCGASARNDTGNMRFVDQRWVDFVPGMFDCTIVREPRFNVAYWNLHEREVAWTRRRLRGRRPAARLLPFQRVLADGAPRPVSPPDRASADPAVRASRARRIFSEYGDASRQLDMGKAPLRNTVWQRGVNGPDLDRHVRKLYLEQPARVG